MESGTSVEKKAGMSAPKNKKINFRFR